MLPGPRGCTDHQAEALQAGSGARVHFVKERDDRRGQILRAVLETGVDVDIYDARGIADPVRARGVALMRLAADLVARRGQRLVIEQDDSLVTYDQAVLFRALRSAGPDGQLTYEHVPPRSEPLLWIPDAAAWAWTHGPGWRQRIEPVVAAVHTL